MAAKTDLSSAHRRARSCHPPTWFLSRGREKGRLLADLHHLARFAGALHTAIKKGRGAHTFSCGRRCPAGADEGIRCAPWPANCPHPAVPARPRKRGSPRSPREKERRPRRVCNSTVKRANNCQDLGGWWRSRRRRPRCSGFGPGASLRSAPATQAPFLIMRYDKSRWSSPRTLKKPLFFPLLSTLTLKLHL